jgi:hypothetical protein
VRDGQVKATLSAQWQNVLVLKDRVNLSDRSRGKFLRALRRREVPEIQDRALLAIEEEIRQHDQRAEGPDPEAIPYVATEAGLVWLKPVRLFTVEVPLTNFGATITTEILQDDGVETARAFSISARLNGRSATFTVTSADFSIMAWPVKELGAEAVVYAGMGLRDHTRAAIQLLSGHVPVQHVYTHIGWRRVGEVWVYLHARGALGADGPVAGFDVAPPPACLHYVLPDPPEGEALVNAVRASHRLVDLGPQRITVPAVAAIPRAVVGDADFSEHLSGGTGLFKTAFAALVQQHFGSEMDAAHLPAAWSSTANSLEAVMFHAKNAVLVIDDFAPTGAHADVQRMHKDADRVLRAQGNRSGRGGCARMDRFDRRSRPGA